VNLFFQPRDKQGITGITWQDVFVLVEKKNKLKKIAEMNYFCGD